MQKKQIQDLMDLIVQWQKNYARKTDKIAHKAKYQELFKLQQYCKKYLAKLKNDQSFDLQATRKLHHQWQDQFQKSNFLGEGQQVGVVQGAYTKLHELEIQMEGIDWSVMTITDIKLDEQYLKEVKNWKTQCQNWLEKQAPQQLLEAQAQTLANTFFANLAKAQATAPTAVLT
ncbi:MAG: hypothetical protein GY810_24625 [Aureispira sp.]|nr:hypothetical protein [Aureispira sp.]